MFLDFFCNRRRLELDRRFSNFFDAIWSLYQRMHAMTAELELLQTEVAEMKSAVAVAIVGIADLKAKLDAAIANAADPAALLSMAADLDKLQADIAAAVAPPVEPPVA